MVSSVALCYVLIGAVEAVAYWAPLWMPPSAHMIALALLTIYLGCHLSLEQEVAQEVSSSDALSFPLVAGAGLTGIYLAFKYLDASAVNHVLRGYLVFVGIATVGDLFRPLVPARLVAVLEQRVPVDFSAPLLGAVRMSALDLMLYVVGAFFSISYAVTRHWLGNNLLGMAFCVSGVGRIAVGQYKTAAGILAGLLVYDLVMVFYTPMMISVATKLDAPIKLLFPTGEPDQYGNPGFSLLGLGDIVIPGILLALMLRVDATRFLRAHRKRRSDAKGTVAAGRASGKLAEGGDEVREISKAAHLIHAPFSKPLFNATWASYSLGLIVTIVVMHVFRHGQPALVYLVPATILVSGMASALRGEFGLLWRYDDADYLGEFKPEDAGTAAEAQPARDAPASSDDGSTDTASAGQPQARKRHARAL